MPGCTLPLPCRIFIMAARESRLPQHSQDFHAFLSAAIGFARRLNFFKKRMEYQSPYDMMSEMTVASNRPSLSTNPESNHIYHLLENFKIVCYDNHGDGRLRTGASGLLTQKPTK